MLRLGVVTMKDLVYYTIGFSQSYIEVIKLSIYTLRKSGWTGDVALICDNSLLAQCKEAIGPDVMYLSIADSKTPEQASTNKLRIFDFPEVSSYDRILFLDGDIIVHMDVNALFSRITRNDVLYVSTETTNYSDHTFIYWSLESYTAEELRYLSDNSIHVFNAGTFAFVRTQEMKTHFKNIVNMISAHSGRFFYEQSFMNVYFNKNNKTDRTVFSPERYTFSHGEKNDTGKIIHFAGNPGNGTTKYAEMMSYINRYFTS